MARRPILRKGRRLPSTGAPCGLELVAQALILASEPLDFAPEGLALSFRAFGALPQDVDLAVRGCRIGARWIRHIEVMPDPRKKYKYEIMDRPLSAGDGVAGTR
jgi:hypothetical protein